MLGFLKNEFNGNSRLKKLEKDAELLRLHKLLKEQIKKNFSSHLKIYILDSGSCNACELEIQALFNPLYDISKLGVEVVYQIEDADIMLVTGLLTENMFPEMLQKYQTLKEPKQLITIGDCPLMQTAFRDSFAIRGQLTSHFDTVYHISGCPPEPKELVRGLLRYMKTL